MRIFYQFIHRWGLTFRTSAGDSWHSYRDLGLLPASPPDFGMPKVKAELVEIPGMDGALDLTEAFGVPRYGTRPGSFTYYLPSRYEAEQDALHAAAANLLHGKVWQITPDESPDAYYSGRLAVGPIVRSPGSLPTFTITGDLDPFRDLPDTDDEFEIDGYHNTVTVTSTPLGGTPRFYNDSGELMLLTADNTEYQIPTGAWTELDGVELPRAAQAVTWDVSCPGGSGTLTVRFTRGIF